MGGGGIVISECIFEPAHYLSNFLIAAIAESNAFYKEARSIDMDADDEITEIELAKNGVMELVNSSKLSPLRVRSYASARNINVPIARAFDRK